MSEVQDQRHQLTAQRSAGVLLIIGVIASILPDAVYGNQSLYDTATAGYFGLSPAWTWVHIVQVAGVLCWAAAVVLLHAVRVLAPRRGRVAILLWGVAAAAVALIVGFRALVVPALLDDFPRNRTAELLERFELVANAVDHAALVPHMLVGAALVVLGLALLRTAALLKLLATILVASGAGLVLGALFSNAVLIVAFTVLSWLALLILAMTLLPLRLRRSQP